MKLFIIFLTILLFLYCIDIVNATLYTSQSMLCNKYFWNRSTVSVLTKSKCQCKSWYVFKWREGTLELPPLIDYSPNKCIQSSNIVKNEILEIETTKLTSINTDTCTTNYPWTIYKKSNHQCICENGISWSKHNHCNIDFSDIEIANKLASKWIIDNHSFNPESYRLFDSITRREVSKIVHKLTWEKTWEECLWLFKDVNKNDWWCLYIESLTNKWIFFENLVFRPNDNITNIEALKIIMLSTWIDKFNSSNWQNSYTYWAFLKWIILEQEYIDFNYNEVSTRLWIFRIIERVLEYDANTKKLESQNELLENVLDPLINSISQSWQIEDSYDLLDELMSE